MNSIRPDLSRSDPAVVRYIEALEAELEQLRGRAVKSRAPARPEEEPEAFYAELEPQEPPTTMRVITATAAGSAKRTPRHLYTRQRRGGMGVFDLDTPAGEPPAILAVADESQHLLLIGRAGQAFRLPVGQVAAGEVRDRGARLPGKHSLGPDEPLAALLPVQAQGYIALASRTGMVRLLRHHVFGEYMKPGMALFDPRAFGPLAAACWTSGEGDLLIATRQGKAIRFSEKLVPPAGGLGIRLGAGDEVVAVAGVDDDSRVFLLSADGRGTVRLMDGFNANKAPGAGGKIALTTDALVGAAVVEDDRDIFIISRLGKIIRFRSAEVPAKEGVVQGVNCMSFRADQAVALAVSGP